MFKDWSKEKKLVLVLIAVTYLPYLIYALSLFADESNINFIGIIFMSFVSMLSTFFMGQIYLSSTLLNGILQPLIVYGITAVGTYVAYVKLRDYKYAHIIGFSAWIALILLSHLTLLTLIITGSPVFP